MSQDQKKRRAGIIAQIIAQVMFGLSFMFTKEATNSATPFQLLSWRFTLAAILFLILIKAGFFKVSFRGKNLKTALLLGTLHPVIYFIFENQGIALTSAGESGTIIATVPIFALIASILVLKYRTNRYQITGIVLTIVGAIILVLGKQSSPTFNLLGYVLLFGCVIAYSIFAILSEKTAEFSSVEKAAIMIFTGAVFFTVTNLIIEFISGGPAAFLRLPFTNHTFLIAILYLGIGSSIIAFTCNNYALETIGTAATSSFQGIGTTVSVLAGAIFLHEQLSFPQIIATILIISGVFIANITPKTSN